MAKKKKSITRLPIKKNMVGSKIFINPSLTLIFNEFMSDADYQYALKEFPFCFESEKIK